MNTTDSGILIAQVIVGSLSIILLIIGLIILFSHMSSLLGIVAFLCISIGSNLLYNVVFFDKSMIEKEKEINKREI